MTPEEAGLAGLHRGDCWGPPTDDDPCSDGHADCRELVADVLAGLRTAGYLLMRDMDKNPDPSACRGCGCEISADGRCPWCDQSEPAPRPAFWRSWLCCAPPVKRPLNTQHPL